jgi:hypothetical protein
MYCGLHFQLYKILYDYVLHAGNEPSGEGFLYQLDNNHKQSL